MIEKFSKKNNSNSNKKLSSNQEEIAKPVRKHRWEDPNKMNDYINDYVKYWIIQTNRRQQH